MQLDGIIEGRFATERDLGSGEPELVSPGAALLGVVGCEQRTTYTLGLSKEPAEPADLLSDKLAARRRLPERESSPLTSELFLGLDGKQREIMLFAVMMRLISNTSHENSNPNPTK